MGVKDVQCKTGTFAGEEVFVIGRPQKATPALTALFYGMFFLQMNKKEPFALRVLVPRMLSCLLQFLPLPHGSLLCLFCPLS